MSVEPQNWPDISEGMRLSANRDCEVVDFRHKTTVNIDADEQLSVVNSYDDTSMIRVRLRDAKRSLCLDSQNLKRHIAMNKLAVLN